MILVEAFFDGMGEKFYYLPLVCLIVACLALCMVGGLAFYHCGLTAGDLTTHEDLRRYYWQLSSPFDRGSCTKNCGSVLCDQTPSAIDENFESGKVNEVRTNMTANANVVVVEVPPPRNQQQQTSNRRGNNDNNSHRMSPPSSEAQHEQQRH